MVFNKSKVEKMGFLNDSKWYVNEKSHRIFFMSKTVQEKGLLVVYKFQFNNEYQYLKY
jgi:hypothetical protein